MARRPAPSRAEIEVARIVWEEGEATVRKVLESLPPSREVDYKTVQTYLRRLEAKGYLSSSKQGRSLVYTARIKPNTVIQETLDDLVNRLFGGDRLKLIEHLIREPRLRPGEIERVRELLDELEG